MTISLEERYVGCLVGLAVGDALGAPLEFMGQDQIPIKHGVVREMIGGGWLGLRPGETTDETALVAALGESLVDRGRLDPEDVATSYRAWLESGPKDVEATTRAALEALAEGYGAHEAAARAHSLSTDGTAGNGTLVRAAPIALLHREQPATAIREAAAEASLTHADPLCAGGSAAVAAVLARILGGERDRRKILDGAHADLDAHGGDRPNVLPDLTRETALRPTPHVVDTLETSLGCWLRAPDLETCLVRTVNLGGESGTTGALAGALAGATWGIEAVPHRWARAVPDRSVMTRIARSLLSKSGAIDR